MLTANLCSVSLVVEGDGVGGVTRICFLMAVVVDPPPGPVEGGSCLATLIRRGVPAAGGSAAEPGGQNPEMVKETSLQNPWPSRASMLLHRYACWEVPVRVS